jgi:hypothetical protein
MRLALEPRMRTEAFTAIMMIEWVMSVPEAGVGGGAAPEIGSNAHPAGKSLKLRASSNFKFEI